MGTVALYNSLLRTIKRLVRRINHARANGRRLDTYAALLWHYQDMAERTAIAVLCRNHPDIEPLPPFGERAQWIAERS